MMRRSDNCARAATREVYGRTLAELGESNPDIVVLDADVSKSTKTCYFAEKFPERFFNVGIAEQNEMLIAAGLAACGKIPFVSSFAVFNTIKVCEQIRTYVCYPNLNVKIAGSHAGLTAARDGVTHQATEDVAVLRAMPNLTIIAPCDDVSAPRAVRLCAKHDGPVYLRLARDPLPRIYDERTPFQIGRTTTLRRGSDIAIIACGDGVHKALEAAEILEKQGVRAALLDMHTIKPIDVQAIVDAAQKAGAVLTVEDHSMINGLGSAVCETLSENMPTPVKRLGLCDTFAESGEYNELLDKYRLGVKTIVAEAMQLIRQKK